MARPKKDPPDLVQLNFRIEPVTKERLDEIAYIESERTGYTITVASILRKIVNEYVKDFK